MKVLYEPPETELAWKVRAPLVVETPTGEAVRIESWSLAGIVWPDDAPACPQTGTLSVPFQGVDIRFPIRLVLQEDGTTVGFEGLSGRQRETLALFYRSLLSGRMASSAEVITSLDTPVDLVPMGETETEQTQQPVRFIPRPLRVAFNVATYLLIATMVVGVLGNNIFTNLDRIDIQHGRVLAPMVQAFPERKGFIETLESAPGSKVRAGDILIRLRDPETQALLQGVEVELGVATEAYGHVAEALAELEDQEGAENLTLRMAVASRLYARFIGTNGFDDMRRQWITLRERNRELTTAYDPLLIVRDILRAEAASRAAKVASLKASRASYLEMIDRNHVRAPTNGTVRALQAQVGAPFGAMDEDLLFETDDPRVTIGWVSERFAETVFIGMPATIGLNERGEKIKIPGAVTDVRAGDHPERPGEFGIVVTVTATGVSSADTKTRLRIGAPVNLEAKRQLGKRFRDWVEKVVARNG